MAETVQFCPDCPMRGDMLGEPAYAAVFTERFSLSIGTKLFKLETESLPMVKFADEDGAQSETIVIPHAISGDEAVAFVERHTQACGSKETERVGIFFRKHDICPALAAYALGKEQHSKKRGA